MKYTNQNGRSMVEMLGVLAIIGVLSVGGIAGYSKAMNKFKINKTTDQVSVLVANLRTMFAAQGNYEGLDEAQAINFGVVPDDMIKSGEVKEGDTPIKNAFGGDVTIKASPLSDSETSGAFTIVYKSLSQEACVTLATGDWGSGQSSGLIAIGAGVIDDLDDAVVGGEGTTAGKDTGVIAQPGGENVKIPMPVSEAVTACAAQSPSVLWKYY
ncbi:MAG: hypothetical protein E7016_00525 [Alphaproteobacteria bacterium]|nr:hypothetical protein [Alphaproteobacteria bacterium]